MRTDILEQAQAIRAATLAAVAHVTEDEDRLGIRVLYDQWEKGKHEVARSTQRRGKCGSASTPTITVFTRTSRQETVRGSHSTARCMEKARKQPCRLCRYRARTICTGPGST